MRRYVDPTQSHIIVAINVIMAVAVFIFALTIVTFGAAMPPPPSPAPVASFEEVLDLPKHPEKLLVDVRNPEELLQTGVIPTSISVPRKP